MKYYSVVQRKAILTDIKIWENLDDIFIRNYDDPIGPYIFNAWFPTWGKYFGQDESMWLFWKHVVEASFDTSKFHTVPSVSAFCQKIHK